MNILHVVLKNVNKGSCKAQIHVGREGKECVLREHRWCLLVVLVRELTLYKVQITM